MSTAIPTNTPRITAFPTNTPRPTFTWTPSPTLTPTITLIPTETLTPSPTLRPSLTWTPSATPTPSRTPTATPSPYPFEGTYATPVDIPLVEIPGPAPIVENDPDIINFVLLGSDTTSESAGRTDVIVLVSVNRRAGNVAMWHLPRDLIVYVPGYTMERINLAYATGIQNNFPGGGPGIIKETILYNFGIPIDYYARVNFTDFQEIIETLGGLDISVDCQITDWALISPDHDPTVEENWEQYTLGIGRKRLSPYYALWYSRSRVTTSDLDRGRRQLDVLRAIYVQARAQGLLAQITELWPQAIEIVNTDLELSDALNLLPLANSLEIQNIERFNGRVNVHFSSYTTPDGRSVLLPNWEAIRTLAYNFVTPPTSNRLENDAVRIEIVDSSAYGIGFDLVAADRLAWEGFSALPLGNTTGSIREITLIYDYTGATKGSALENVMEILRVGDSQVIFEPDPNRTVDFRVEMGRDYNSCIYGSSADELAPRPPVEEFGGTLEEEASPLAPTPAGQPNTVG
ncbi:MAG: hypothetical protein HC915_01800 [Anaerolineae bacterium]|nr:hypothetical protein [Anaerolineae bacterium]